MNKFITAASIISSNRNGWTVEAQMIQEAKKDGTANRARRPVPNGVEIHRHPHGHVRIYVGGTLKFERYTSGSDHEMAHIKPIQFNA